MSIELATGKPIMELVRLAREQHRAGGGAVLDVLRRSVPDHQQLELLLQKTAGVTVLAECDTLTPDFSLWSRGEARSSRAIVLGDGLSAPTAAMEDPWDDAKLQSLTARLGRMPSVAAVTKAQFEVWLADEGSLVGAPVQPSVDAAVSPSGPVVSFVDDALTQGFLGGASDVHFECDRLGVTVKFRLDGVMVAQARMDGKRQAEEVISRIKVMSSLDITERRLPQDGRIRLTLGGAAVDLRVSIMPSVHGEDAVLRLLDKSQLRGKDASVSLDSLAFEAKAAATVRELATLPSGMLLVTGPTGSGKTTTVYAALSEINTGLEKIITIEDPVEYELQGVLQIPVNERKGLTFAKGLRSILRHDPDRILVGEIRDAETAEIAVQSALTGHLVFTTVHANSMADIIGRFRHFNIDMFGFMSALNGVVVQRLLRRLCPDCMSWRSPSEQELRWLAAQGVSDPTRVPQELGCPACRGTGFKGRFVVAELHVVDDEFRDLITAGAPLSALKTHARARGVEDLLAKAARHVNSGETTMGEVRRVVGAWA